MRKKFDRILAEAKKKIAGNLCVNTGQGSGGGFSSCGKGGSSDRATAIADAKRVLSDVKAGRETRLHKANEKPKSGYIAGERPPLRIIGTTKNLDTLKDAVEKKVVDLCKAIPKTCEKNLGIPRDKMPQLSADVTDKFLSSLKSEGIAVETTVKEVGDLKATQKEINAEKVLGMAMSAATGKFNTINDPIVVSRDGYVLDGHHRWAALRSLHPKNQMKVHRVDLAIEELLNRSLKFEGVEQRGLREARERARSVLKHIQEACCASCAEGKPCESRKSAAGKGGQSKRGSGRSMLRNPLPPRITT